MTAVVRSGRLALGPHCVEFEEAVARYVGVRHAVAVNSGTAALHLLVRGLGIGIGDEVLVPSFTFVASVNAILYERATPALSTSIRYIQSRPCHLGTEDHSAHKAIMAWTLWATGPWMPTPRSPPSQTGLIDDASRGLALKPRQNSGAWLRAAFAFYPNKQKPPARGVIVTDNDDWPIREERAQPGQRSGPWLEHVRLGFNYRLYRVSAALDCSQFKRLDGTTPASSVAAMYEEKLRDIAGLFASVEPSVRMSCLFMDHPSAGH